LSLGLLGILTPFWVSFWGLLMVVPAGLLLFYPRLFRVANFMEDKQLNREDAKRYAWHCSVIVLPEILGILRFFIGWVTGRPLRNNPHSLKTGLSKSSILLCLFILLLQSACIPVSPVPEATHQNNSFHTDIQEATTAFAPPLYVEEQSERISDRYLLGPGDILNLRVWNREELSDPDIIVGPDGIITVSRIGNIRVGGRKREDVAAEITAKLSKFYQNPEVSLSVKAYKNNKAFVLGRVENPGVVNFPGKGTLLEALSLAGGLPVLEKEAFLTKCAIIRGKHKIIWIDLRELLNNGNMALNARIQNNDVIFIPESDDENVYVMGEVIRPGTVRLRLQMAFLDALMLSGGPTEDANLEKIYILRFNKNESEVQEINLKHIIETGDINQNYQLKANDIVYVSEKGISKFNYVMKQLMPFLEVLQLSTTNLESFGVMQQLRKELWGQEGFVSQ